MGALKVVLSLERQAMPTNMHLKICNPKLDLDGFAVVMPLTVCELAGTLDAAASAINGAVSSFGMSGTNAHAVLESARHQRQQQVFYASKQKFLYRHQLFVWWQDSSILASPLLCDKLPPSALSSMQVDVWERNWPKATCRYLENHRIGAVPVASNMVFMQLARAVALTARGSETHASVKCKDDRALLHLDRTGRFTPTLRVQLDRSDLAVSFDSFVDGQNIHVAQEVGTWHHHAEMILAFSDSSIMPASSDLSLSGANQSCDEIDGTAFYGAIANRYSGDFACVAQATVMFASDHTAEPIVLTKLFSPSNDSSTQVCILHDWSAALLIDALL